jgi:hypothetical protein
MDQPVPAPARPRSPLRVGLLVDSLRQPAWVHRAVADIVGSDVAEVVVVVVGSGTGGTDVAGWARAGGVRSDARDQAAQRYRSTAGNGTSLLFDLYRRFDVYWFKDDRPDPFADADLGSVVSRIPRIAMPARAATGAHGDERGAEGTTGASRDPKATTGSSHATRASTDPETDDATARAVAELISYDLDVAIRLGADAPLRGVPGLARFGVWSYESGGEQPSAIEPGYREVLTGSSVTRSALVLDATATSRGRVLYESFASTAALSAWKNRRELYWKTSAFVMRALRELADVGAAAIASPSRGGADPAPPVAVAPGNLAMLAYLPRLAARYAATQVAMRTSFDQWFIAYRFAKDGENPEVPDTRLRDFTRLIPPKDRMWADPFPIRRGDRHLIFVEELLFARNKGHISVMEFDPHGHPTRPEMVLETENHLSYPFLLDWKGETFMIPESARAGDNPADRGSRSVPVFRARRFPHDWVQDTVILEGLEVFDPTIAHIDGMWWLFCTQAEPGASTWDELHLFHGPTPFGPWAPHRRNPVKSDVRSARPAGRPYFQNGAWYRPAQNCSVRYGYALSINRIDRLTTSEYHETEVMRLLPDWAPDLIGTHTLNAAGGLSVTDGRMRRRKSAPEAPELPARDKT